MTLKQGKMSNPPGMRGIFLVVCLSICLSVWMIAVVLGVCPQYCKQKVENAITLSSINYKSLDEALLSKI